MWSVNKEWLKAGWINGLQWGNSSAARHPADRSCDPVTKVICDCFLAYPEPKSNPDWDRCLFYLAVWFFASSHGAGCSATCHSTDLFRPLATPATHRHTPSSVSIGGKAPLYPAADGIQYRGVMRNRLRALNLNSADCFCSASRCSVLSGKAALANFTSFTKVQWPRPPVHRRARRLKLKICTT